MKPSGEQMGGGADAAPPCGPYRRGARVASVPAARAPKKWGIQISEPASTRPAEVWPACKLRCGSAPTARGTAQRPCHGAPCCGLRAVPAAAGVCAQRVRSSC